MRTKRLSDRTHEASELLAGTYRSAHSVRDVAANEGNLSIELESGGNFDMSSSACTQDDTKVAGKNLSVRR
jgi:hypothetical protein